MTEKEKLEQDLRLYGICFEKKDGKRIDPRTVERSGIIELSSGGAILLSPS